MTGSPICELPTETAADELTLRIIGTEHDGRILRIQAAKCTIGSGRDCTLRLRAPGVQNLHCLILRGPGGLAAKAWSRDTTLNGRAFSDAQLNAGDRLTIGPIELEILAAGVSTQSPSDRSGDQQLRLQRLERTAREEAQQRAQLAAQVAEREQFVGELQKRLAETESLVERLRQESLATPVTSAPPAVDPDSLLELEALKHQAEELAAQFDLARTSFATERDAWQVERGRLEFAVAEAERRLEMLTATLNQARAEFADQQAEWQTERTQLGSDLEKLRHSHQELVENLRESSEAKVAVTHWREQYEEQVRLLADRERQIAELHAGGVTTADEKQLELRAELEAAARELDAETEKLLAAEEEFEKKRAQWKVECDNWTTAWEQRRGELDTQTAGHVELEQALAREREELSALRAGIEHERQSVDQFREELNAQSTLESSLATERAALEQERQTAFAELSALRDRLYAERATFQEEQTHWQAEREASAVVVAQAQSNADASMEANLAAERAALEQERQAAFAELLALRDQLNAERATFQEERANWLAEREASQPVAQVLENPVEEQQPETDAPSESIAAESVQETPYVPTSAADVIARLSASGLWQDDDSETEVPESNLPEPAWKSLVPAEPVAKPAAVAPVEDDDSIEAYMQRLLMRVSGDSESSRPKSGPRIAPTVVAAPAPDARDFSTPHEDLSHADTHEPFDFKSYVPRSSAPELTKNLSAMRELANSTARQAIDASSKRQRRGLAHGKYLFALVTTAVAFGSYWFASVYGSALSYGGAITATITAGWWWFQAFALWRAVRREERAEQQAEARSLAQEPTETAGPVASTPSSVTNAEAAVTESPALELATTIDEFAPPSAADMASDEESPVDEAPIDDAEEPVV